MVKIELNKKLEVGGSLKPLSFQASLAPNAILGISGPSGCGKTSILKLIAGLMPADELVVELNGRCIRDTKQGIDSPLNKQSISMLFQSVELLPHLSVEEHVKWVNPSEPIKSLEASLSALGLLELSKQRPNRLSGGQQQRLGLLMCLLTHPDLLLLDEPFSAQDENNRQAMMKLIKGFQGRKPFPVILVSHQQEWLSKNCTSVQQLEPL